MREQMRLIVAACFYYSGLVKLAYWWIRRRSGRHLIILKYHRATGGDLRRQMLYLSRHYRIMHLEAALEELFYAAENNEKHDKRIPMVMTFDDGYRDNYTYGFALARQLHVPITIFLAPGYIESGACFWWLESERLVHHAQVEEIKLDECIYHLGQQEERKELSQTIDTRLRYATSVAQREAYLADVRKMLGVPAERDVEEATLPVTWAEVHEMEESGWVSFGAHTMHHPILACLADSEEVRWEVEECRKVLEQQLGHAVRSFAYPIGEPENIGDEGLRAVKAAGYKWALTTIEETCTSQAADLHFLPRLTGNVNTHWLVMASELVGLLRIVSRLKKKLRHILIFKSAST